MQQQPLRLHADLSRARRAETSTRCACASAPPRPSMPGGSDWQLRAAAKAWAQAERRERMAPRQPEVRACATTWRRPRSSAAEQGDPASCGACMRVLQRALRRRTPATRATPARRRRTPRRSKCPARPEGAAMKLQLDRPHVLALAGRVPRARRRPAGPAALRSPHRAALAHAAGRGAGVPGPALRRRRRRAGRPRRPAARPGGRAAQRVAALRPRRCARDGAAGARALPRAGQRARLAVRRQRRAASRWPGCPRASTS